MTKWTDIEQVHHLRKRFNHRFSKTGQKQPLVSYKAKIKLHGTNAGIQIHEGGTVVAQGRNRVLGGESKKDDNMGFGKWVMQTRDYWSKQILSNCSSITVYGEWCGQGIQHGCSISLVPKKMFCVFALHFNFKNTDEPNLSIDPVMIRSYLSELDGAPEGLHIIPWFPGGDIVLDYSDPVQLQESCDLINELVLEVEKCDPFVKETFGVEGMGEGLVYYPVNFGYRRCDVASYMFKAKGEKHRTVKTKKAASIDPVHAKNVADFVELVVSEARLEQGLQEVCGGEADIKKTGDFLKWVGQDVHKECQVELDAACLSWKDVGKGISKRAALWFKEKAQCIQS